MEIQEYQQQAKLTAIYPKETKVMYPLLGLAGEVGETLNKLKKVLRDRGATTLSIHTIPAVVIDKVEAELGDIIWYISALASDLNLDLDSICRKNLDKLFDRKVRGTLKGEGDNR